MPGFIGFPELIVLAIVLLLIFGPKRLPEVGRSLGRGMREFKDSVTTSGADMPPAETPPIRHMEPPDPNPEAVAAAPAPDGGVETPA